MKILVPGGAGYIGSHAVYLLIGQGHEVAVIDNLQTGHEEAVHPDAVLYRGDIRDRKFLREVFLKERAEAVMHFAASSLVGESMMEPLDYFDNNVFGTQVILEVMREFSVPFIIFSSSAAVYGNPSLIPINEVMETKPQSPYGETKLTMEKMIEWCSKAHGIKYVSLRYFNAAGASPDGKMGEDHTPETHLIPLVLQTALGFHDAVTVFGEDYRTKDGTCIRDYVHVVDLAEAHLLALQYLADGGDSGIFNLGSAHGFSVKEVISAAQQVTGRTIPIKPGKRRVGDPDVLIASSKKAAEILGWKPRRTSIEEIILDAWKWHKRFPEGYAKIYH